MVPIVMIKVVGIIGGDGDITYYRRFHLCKADKTSDLYEKHFSLFADIVTEAFLLNMSVCSTIKGIY